MVAAFRILGEGQLSLTKFLLVLDEARDLKEFRGTLEHVLARCDFRSDLYVFGNLSMDSLDYTGPRVNEGSKGVLLGVGDPIRTLPRAFQGEVPRSVRRAEVFCGGCLVLETNGEAKNPELAQAIVEEPAFADWPLLVLVDDAAQTVRSPFNFLWVTFTRFEPAADIYAARVTLVRQHVSYDAPILLDARRSPQFPDELFCDGATATKVDSRWKEYFPDAQVEMGDSDRAHLD
jgi:4-hydroxybenzoate decarboxylase subunit C